MYEIVALAAETPDTTPVVVPAVATVASLLDHMPPVVVLLKVVAEPTQTTAAPVIVAGRGLTVNAFVARHVEPSE